MRSLSCAIAFLLLSPILWANQESDWNIRPLNGEVGIVQTVLYTGKILDNTTSEPLIGATVKVKDTSIGTITDVNGNFSIRVPDNISPVILEISFIGYTKKEITLQKRIDNIIRLEENMRVLDEVQIVAYGKQSKISVTGAISSVKTSDLLKSPSGSAAGSLSGAITGVSSVQLSGQPGAEDPDIYVRGTGSLTSAASKPLILVDGIERSFFRWTPMKLKVLLYLRMLRLQLCLVCVVLMGLF